MLKRILPVLALAALLGACATNLVNQGRQLTEQGQHDRAIELLYKEIAARPDNTAAWQELGVAFYKKGDYAKSEDALKKADKASPRAHLYLGLVNEALGEYDHAVASYTAAMKLQPKGKTRDMIRTHLDQLIHKKVEAQVAEAVGNEASIDVSEIPPNTIAVTDFDGSSLTPDLAPIAIGLAELTAADLTKVRSLQVVERLKLDVLMSELKLGEQGAVDQAKAPRMGRLLGSSRLVTGSVLDMGEGRIRLDGAIVDTRDSTTTIPEPAEGELQQFFEVQKDLVFKVVQDLGVQLTAEERNAIQAVPTESYVAFLAYCRGLDYGRKGMYGDAQREFNAALQADPNFGAANEQLQTSAAMQAPPVTTAALTATADQMGAGEQRIRGNDSRLSAMSARADNTLSAPKIPPGAEGTGTIIIKGDLDGE